MENEEENDMQVKRRNCCTEGERRLVSTIKRPGKFVRKKNSKENPEYRFLVTM
jgi:hypothetical protein